MPPDALYPGAFSAGGTGRKSQTSPSPGGTPFRLGDDCVSKMRGSVFAVVDLDIAGAVLVHKEQHAGQRDSQTGQNSEHYFQKFHGRPSLTAQTARRGMRLRVRLVVV